MDTVMAPNRLFYQAVPTLQKAFFFYAPCSRTSRQRDRAVTSTQQTRQLRAAPQTCPQRRTCKSPLARDHGNASPRGGEGSRRNGAQPAALNVCSKSSRHGFPNIRISCHDHKTENHNAVTTRQVCHLKNSLCPQGVTKPHTDPRAEVAEKGHSELVQAGQRRFAAALKTSPEVPTQEGPLGSSRRCGSPGSDPAGLAIIRVFEQHPWSSTPAGLGHCPALFMDPEDSDGSRIPGEATTEGQKPKVTCVVPTSSPFDRRVNCS
ncbi:hypothetical protein PAL_GLEAN10008942 [Pteropus alecto]|uniref:Uncharacterized protein n=1 Tax=Pteropus alecto TaxID=9402 RepID=L5KJG6_PTEAL|nr:hypothetical protein PAL_GLEAN10008942 [Pteropus alecto]